MALERNLEKHELSSGSLQTRGTRIPASNYRRFGRDLADVQEDNKERDFTRGFTQTYTPELQNENPRHWSRLPSEEEEPTE